MELRTCMILCRRVSVMGALMSSPGVRVAAVVLGVRQLLLYKVERS